MYKFLIAAFLFGCTHANSAMDASDSDMATPADLTSVADLSLSCTIPQDCPAQHTTYIGCTDAKGTTYFIVMPNGPTFSCLASDTNCIEGYSKLIPFCGL